ncbi:MAG: hypothetical protein GXO32_06045 [Crenarchaeota archaeon]|nr:hypothetical protein [Thermoproteota archaeon]
MDEFLELLVKALEIERVSIESYARWMEILESAGALSKPVANFLISIIEDSVLHKNLVNALIKSLREIREIENKLRAGSREQVVARGVDVRQLLREAVKEHIEIERGVSQLYRELAKRSSKQLVRAVLEAIARDEDRHEEYVSEIERLAP